MLLLTASLNEPSTQQQLQVGLWFDRLAGGVRGGWVRGCVGCVCV